jgi:hypothetical protein
LQKEYGQGFIDSLMLFQSCTRSFSNEDATLFNNLFEKLRNYDFPSYDEVELLKSSGDLILPEETINENNWEEQFSELDIVKNEINFSLGNLREVNYVFNLSFSLIDLEKLKDFKVTKLN